MHVHVHVNCNSTNIRAICVQSSILVSPPQIIPWKCTTCIRTCTRACTCTCICTRACTCTVYVHVHVHIHCVYLDHEVMFNCGAVSDGKHSLCTFDPQIHVSQQSSPVTHSEPIFIHSYMHMSFCKHTHYGLEVMYTKTCLCGFLSCEHMQLHVHCTCTCCTYPLFW